MNKKLMLFSLVLLSIGYGCEKTVEISTPVASVKTETKKLYNPYALDNMRKTLANLLLGDVQLLAHKKQQYARGKIMASSGSGLLTINSSLSQKESAALVKKSLLATHYHIKFMPANDTDYGKLKADSNLVLYPFPLDAAVSQYNGSYRDPAVPAGIPTYQYAAVPVNYALPNVPYVILADLYLPDEQKPNSTITIKGDGNSSYTITVEALVNESLCNPSEEEIAYEVAEDECGDNYGGGGYSPGTGAPSGEWRPNGRITVYDDVLGQTIGVEGIKVRARRWFTTYTGITDANGYYHVDGTYTRPANYWLDFERYDFSVNDHHGGPQEVNGPKIEAPWNYNFEGYNKFCATIFRAAHHYYYKDIQGLRRPPQNSFWATQVKIAAFDWDQVSDNGDMWAGRNVLFGSLIHIYKPTRPSSEIYATTIHELAHAEHWDALPHSFYGTTNIKVIESYATGIQWVLTKMVYPNYIGKWCAPGESYKNVIIDMIDGYDSSYTIPSTIEHTGLGGNLDLVEGYTINQIQDALYGQTTWNGWRDNIKSLYNNGTEQHLDALFDNWYNY